MNTERTGSSAAGTAAERTVAMPSPNRLRRTFSRFLIASRLPARKSRGSHGVARRALDQTVAPLRACGQGHAPNDGRSEDELRAQLNLARIVGCGDRAKR